MTATGDIRTHSQFDWRLPIVAAVLALLVGIQLTPLSQQAAIWRLLGVPAMFPKFADARVITSGWECTAGGIDVLAANPCDPWRRPDNYPRIWTAPALFHLDQRNTAVLAAIFAAAFLLTVFFLMGRRGWRQALVYLAILLSPPCLLVLERGNNDQLIFALLGLALLAVQSIRWRRQGLTAAILLVTAILKLYPAIALLVLLRRYARAATIGLAAALLAFAAYLMWTRNDVALILKGTPRATNPAYGVDVIAAGLGITPQPLVHWMLVGVAITLAAVVAARLGPRFNSQTGGWQMDAFWLGGLVFGGTFLLGTNFDYRLIFLIFTAPQLLQWAQSTTSVAAPARIGLILMLAAMWLARAGDPPSLGQFVLDQVLKEAVFAFLGGIIVWQLILRAAAWEPGHRLLRFAA
jgi:hypothetical protein